MAKIFIPHSPTGPDDVQSREEFMQGAGDDSPNTVAKLEAPVTRAGGDISSGTNATEKALYFLESVLSGAGNVATFVPDYLLNRAIDIGVMSGAIDSDIDRDLLNRYFYSRQYEKTEDGMGKGRYVGFQEPATRIGQAVGEAAFSALPVVAGGAVANSVISGGRALSAPALRETSEAAGRAAGEGALRGAGREVATSLGEQFAKGAGRMAATEAAIGGTMGAVTEAADIAAPGAGQFVALAPAAGMAIVPSVVRGILKVTPTGRALTWASEQPETQGVWQKFKDGVAARFTSESRLEQQAKEKVRAIMRDPDSVANSEKAAEINRRIKEVTDMELTLVPAEKSLNPVLLREQAISTNKMSGQALLDENARKRKNMEVMYKFRDSVFDETDAAPSAIIDAATGRVQAVRLKNEKQLTELNTAFNDLTETQVPTLQAGEAPQIGYSVRQQLINRRDAAEKAADRMAQKLQINTANPLGNAAVVQKELLDDLKITDTDFAYQNLHPLVRKFLEFNFQGKGKDGKITFQDWKQTRSDIGSAIGLVANDAERRQLSILKSKLDDILFRNAKTADSYRKFADFYDANVILPFEDAVVQKVMRRSEAWRPDAPAYLTPNEAVASSFLKDSSTAQTFMRLFGSSQRDIDAIRDTVLDQVAQKAVRDGRINPQDLERYTTQKRDVLQNLLVRDPKTGESKTMLDLLTDVRSANEALLKREAMLTARAEKISHYKLNEVLRSDRVAGLPSNLAVEEIIDYGLKNPKVMVQLARTSRASKDPEVVKAFNRAVFDRIVTPSDLENPEALIRFFVKNETLLRTALGKEHYDDYLIIAEGARRLQAAGYVSGGQGLDRDTLVDRMERVSGFSAESLTARGLAVKEGRNSINTVGVWMASQAIRAGQSAAQDKAREAALFDPEIAADLAAPTERALEVTARQARNLAAKLFYYGIQDPSVEPDVKTFEVDFGTGETDPETGRPLITIPGSPAPQPAPPPEPVPVPQIAPGQQGSLQRPPAPANMNTSIQNMARAMPPQPPQGPAPAQQQGIAGSRYAALFPGDTLGAMAASGGIGSLRG